MLKNKRILLIILIAIVLFLIPSMCNAAETAATQTSTTSTGVTVKWSYELEGETIVGLRCTNISEISGSVEIPSTIDGYKVVTIGTGNWNGGIFYKCSGLTGVTIPNTVTTIEKHCFEECVGLTSVVIPNSVTSIKDQTFDGCSGLSSVTLSENLSSIGSYAFRYCTGITSITLPNKLTQIGSSAFYECTGLTSLIIPDSVTKIDEQAFYGCSGIENLTISKSLTKLPEYIFAYCKGLTSVIIPDKVTSIMGSSYAGAFYNCTNLEKVLIPDKVATIEKYAFEKCSKSLTIYGNEGKASKRFAEENNINFDYIENWNKAPVGEDISAPILKSLVITNFLGFDLDSGTGYYLVSVGTNISIKATFDEIIYGTTAPKLTIKCGNGANIELTDGVIQGSHIIYTYRIKDQDKGIISAVSMTGGDIKDEAGNKVEKYTCPELVDSMWGDYLYANGTNSTPGGNQGNNNDNNGNDGNNETKVTLTSITITKAPTKNTYTQGDSFDKSGMVITATYSDGSTKQINNYSISPAGALNASDKKVVISYTENGVTKTVEQGITVTPKTNSAVTLTSIKITKAPTKTSYNEGEKFNKAGMVVKATYSDGSTKQITTYSISPSDKLKTTDKKVIILYSENGITKTVEQKITVKDPTTKNDNKLPQTGAAVLSLALISLSAVAVISKVKYGKFKDI